MSDQSPLQSNVNVFVDWAKARLDEMAANAGALEKNLDELDAKSRAQAEQAIAQLNQWIEQGQNDIKTAQAQGEAQVAQAKADMEALWANFQNNAGDWAGLLKDNQAMFQARAQAQIQAWQDTVNAYMERVNEVHDKNKAQAEAQVAQLQADANKAQADLTAKVDELTKAGQSSWAAMSDALDQSRNAFAKSIETAAKNFNDALKS
jgi:predicted  nucleic acid-binding Zn-ribbon protein